MTPQIMERAVNIASSCGKQIHFQISGGEPCLNREMIFKTVRKIRKTVPDADIALQTNATCLDDELVFFFKESDIQLGVSLDGTQDVHEKQRGSFRDTIIGIERLEKFNVPWRATAVVTADSIGELWRLVLLVARFGTVRGIGLDFLTLKGRAKENSVITASPEAVRYGIERFLDALDVVNQNRTSRILFRESEKVLVRNRTPYFCYAAKGESMAVYPDGTVYPCSQLCGEREWCAGEISKKIDWSLLKIKNTTLNNESCASCELDGICPGDCPARLMYNNEIVRKNICALYQAIAKRNRRDVLL